MEEPSRALDSHPPGSRATGGRAGADTDAPIRFFLIADVRGYTSFTQEHGDESAGQLAARFADVTRSTVAEYQGRLVELRGDEALVAFTSARSAIRAALAVQDRYVDETLRDTTLPLTVGIGVDAGEAVPVEGGFRGGALNLAARLCAMALAGEVLASSEVTHLAGSIEGVTYVPRGQHSMKGIDEPVAVVEVRPQSVDPQRAKAFAQYLAVGRASGRTNRPSRRAVVIGAVAAMLLAATGGYTVSRITSVGASTVPGDHAEILDAADGKQVAEVQLGDQPTSVAVGEGSVWITNRGDATVSRIDPASHQVLATILVGGDPGGIAVAGRSVWVTDQSGTSVARINPEVNRVVGHVRVGNQPDAIAAGPQGLWVANSADSTVMRIDPRSGRAGEPVGVGADPSAIAVTDDAVWVADGIDRNVWSFDAATPKVQHQYPIGLGATGLAVAAGNVWVANQLDGTVTELEADSGKTIATIPVGNGPTGAAVDSSGKVWVTDEYGGSLVRIDATTSQPDQTLDVNGLPRGIGVSQGTLWVATGASGADHSGGTLNIDAGLPNAPTGSLDPATMTYDQNFFKLLSLTSDGLVGFQHAAGASGSTLVPDLAVSLPPAGNGKQYSFKLREGIEYSTGRLVRPSDFVRGLQRVFSLPNAPLSGDYLSIVGAAKCWKTRQGANDKVPAKVLSNGQGDAKVNAKIPSTPCDLSQGIVANDRTGTVTFYLTKPDQDFLYKLALPSAFPVPPGTPDHDTGTSGVPGTGPYELKQYALGKTIELVRNPNFHEWSWAAQPRGYPDEIVVDNRTPEQGLHDVLKDGTADLATGPFPGKMRRLSASYTTQLHENASPFMIYLTLDDTSSPFKNVLARRALNYAVNRTRYARLAPPAQPTCLILPPGTPGYAPSCPYPQNLRRAKQLVRQSGTKGDRVNLVWPKTQLTPGKYVESVLRGLGYDVHLYATPDNNYYGRVFAMSHHHLVASNGWGADYPAASGYLEPLLSCRYAETDTTGFNLSHFCDPALDALMQRAKSLQQSQPAKAAKLWQQADSRAVADAAFVPLSISQDIMFTSKDAQNYEYQPNFGVLWDQIWLERAAASQG